jgi:hypothetical protein
MKRNTLLTMLMVSSALAGALVAVGQEANVTDFRSWLSRQQQPVADADPATERQAIRDRIAAGRASRGRVTALNANGHWRSERLANLSTRRLREQQWFVQLERNAGDGTVSGHLTVVGSGSLTGGVIAGRITDTQLSGTVTDDTGAQLATFIGTVNGNAMSGSYTTHDGDSGDWSYDDPTQQRQRVASDDAALVGESVSTLIEDTLSSDADAAWDAPASP